MFDDMTNRCFICNIERMTFDRYAEGGFVKHIDQDHNLWNYIYYIVLLKNKDPTDYTGIESYVSLYFERGQINWVPRQQALLLKEAGEGEEIGEAEKEVQELRKEIKVYNEQMSNIHDRLEKLSKGITKLKKEIKVQ